MAMHPVALAIVAFLLILPGILARKLKRLRAARSIFPPVLSGAILVLVGVVYAADPGLSASVLERFKFVFFIDGDVQTITDC